MPLEQSSQPFRREGGMKQSVKRQRDASCLTPFIKVRVQISFDLSRYSEELIIREAEPTESPTANLVEAFRGALLAPADPKVE